MTTLYEISSEYQKLLDQDEYDVIDLERLNQLDGDLRQKAIQVSCYILNKQLILAGMLDAINRMEQRAERLQNRIVHLSEYLKENLVKANIPAIDDHPEFEIRVKTNPPKVEILDAACIPERFLSNNTVVTPDKKAIKEAIESGLDIQGVKLVQETRLVIK